MDANNKIYKIFDTEFDGHHIVEQFYICYGALLQHVACWSTSLYQTDRIKTVISDAASLVFWGSRRDHATLILRDRLHWLRSSQRIHFKVVLLVYKAINNLAPDYITIYCRVSIKQHKQPSIHTSVCRQSDPHRAEN